MWPEGRAAGTATRFAAHGQSGANAAGPARGHESAKRGAAVHRGGPPGDNEGGRPSEGTAEGAGADSGADGVGGGDCSAPGAEGSAAGSAPNGDEGEGVANGGSEFHEWR